MRIQTSWLDLDEVEAINSVYEFPIYLVNQRLQCMLHVQQIPLTVEKQQFNVDLELLYSLRAITNTITTIMSCRFRFITKVLHRYYSQT